MNQCKCVASGFLANGGILEIWGKSQLKTDILFILLRLASKAI
jgi:hypothetical protein